MSDCLKFRIICRDNIFLMGEQNVNCDPRILLKAFSAIDDIFFPVSSPVVSVTDPVREGKGAA